MQAAEAQTALHAAERDKDRFSSELRVEKSRNGDLTQQVEDLTAELAASERKGQADSSRLNELAVLEQRLGEAETGLAGAEAELEKQTGAVKELKAERDGLEAQVGDLSQNLADREKELELTRKLVTAVKEREELNREIENATTRLGRRKETVEVLIAATAEKL